MYTFYPFTEHHCDHVEPVIVNYFNKNQFKYSLNIFADKFKNMYKCNLTVSISNFPPWTIITKKIDGKFDINGIEGTLIHDITRAMNFTLVIVYIPPKLGFGKIQLEMVMSPIELSLPSGQTSITMQLNEFLKSIGIEWHSEFYHRLIY